MNYKFEFYTKDIVFKGYNIQTYIIGTGTSTVFSFPSFPHSGLMYLWFLNHYDLSKVKFITFDLPGWIGNSENIFAAEPFAMDTLIEIAKKIIHEHEVGEFSTIGYSFGGSLALMLNSAMPERIKKIVLVSAIINSDLSRNENIVRLAKAAGIFNRINLVSGIFTRYVKNRFNFYKQALAAMHAPANELSMYSGMLDNLSGKTSIDSINQLFNSDFTVYLKELQNKPVMIVNSHNESKLFRTQAEYLRKHLPAEKSLFFHGSHEDFVLKPKSDVVKEVVRFLV